MPHKTYLKNMKTPKLISSKVVEKEDLKIIGPALSKRLRKLRKDNGLSRKFVAEKSKISNHILMKIEKGQKMISIKQSKLLAKIYKTSPQFIIAGIKD